MRVVVALAVEVGLIAVIAQGVVTDRTAFLALGLAPAGYLLSYRRRGRPNVIVKAALAAGLLLALSRFLGQMGSVASADAARAPLAALFVWGPGAPRLRRAEAPRPRLLDGVEHDPDRGGRRAGAVDLLPRSAARVGDPCWDVAVVVVATARRRTRRRSGTHALATDRAGPFHRTLGGRGDPAAFVFTITTFLLPRIPSTMVRALPFRMAPGAATAPATTWRTLRCRRPPATDPSWTSPQTATRGSAM